MTFFLKNVSSRSYYIWVKYHCSLDSLNCFCVISFKCSSRGPREFFYPIVELGDFRRGWTHVSSLLCAQIRALGWSARWRRQKNFRFKQDSRSEETTNNRLETHPQCGQSLLHYSIFGSWWVSNAAVWEVKNKKFVIVRAKARATLANVNVTHST